MYPEHVWPKQVGNRYLPSKKILSYHDIYEEDPVTKVINKWIDPKKYLPFNCDLVTLKYNNKEVPGWWNGRKWVGLRINNQEPPLFWKRIVQVHDVIDHRMERINQILKLQKKFANFK